jgi:hypothetical protein
MSAISRRFGQPLENTIRASALTPGGVTTNWISGTIKVRIAGLRSVGYADVPGLFSREQQCCLSMARSWVDEVLGRSNKPFERSNLATRLSRHHGFRVFRSGGLHRNTHTLR